MDYDRKEQWLEIRLDRNKLRTEEQIDDFLLKTIAVPPRFLQKLRQENGLSVAGDRIRLRLFPYQQPNFSPEWRELEILHEDDFCLVINKPAGIKVHPTEDGETGTLAQAVAGYYEQSGQLVSVRHIHRLDRDTSGPVLYAKNDFAQTILDEAMRSKQIERIYSAWVSGRMSKDAGTIDAPIGKDRHQNGKMRVSVSGKRAVSRYRLIRQYQDAAEVEVRLDTGRTHQIRVHMSHIGHPILGDALYGKPHPSIGWQALHGAKLRFPHPFGGESLEVEAPIPGDLQRLIEFLR